MFFWFFQVWRHNWLRFFRGKEVTRGTPRVKTLVLDGSGFGVGNKTEVLPSSPTNPGTGRRLGPQRDIVPERRRTDKKRGVRNCHPNWPLDDRVTHQSWESIMGLRRLSRVKNDYTKHRDGTSPFVRNCQEGLTNDSSGKRQIVSPDQGTVWVLWIESERIQERNSPYFFKGLERVRWTLHSS